MAASAPGFENDDELARRRRMADLLLRGATDASPVGHWTQALARALQGAMAGYGGYRDRMDREAGNNALLDMFSNRSSGSPPPLAPSGGGAMPGLGTASAADAPKPMDYSVRPEISTVARSLAGGASGPLDFDDMRLSAQDAQPANAGAPVTYPQGPNQVSALPNPHSNLDAAGRFRPQRYEPGSRVSGNIEDMTGAGTPLPPLAINGGLPLTQQDVDGGVISTVPPIVPEGGGVAGALAGSAPQAIDFRGQRGPASIRFNNPGAQYPGESARKFGSTGTETIGGGHKIAVFPDAVSGAAAQFDLLNRRYTGMPLSAAITRWSGGNSSSAYIARVTKETGLSPETVLTPDLLQSPQGVKLASSMAGMEAGRRYPMGDEQWAQAQRLAFGGQLSGGGQPPASALGQPQPPVRMAQASVSREQLKRLLDSPHTRPLGLRLLMEMMGPQGEAGQLALERQRLELENMRRGEPGKITVLPEGGTAILSDPRTGQHQVLATGSRKQSEGERKSIEEADTQSQAAQTSLGTLKKLDQLNRSAYSGPGAGALSTIMAPIGNKGAQDTQVMQNLLVRNAVDQLKSSFGGNPTEGERQVLIDLQGSINQPAPVRARIFQEARELLQQRIEINRQRSEQMRAGTYYQPGGGVSPPGQQPSGGGGPTRTINGKTYVQMNGQWYEQ